MNLGRVWKILEKTYFILFCIYIVAFSFSKVSDNPRSVIWSDSEGYYKYLPGLFIIQDIHKIPEGSIWPTYTENGEYIIKYTCGIAILQLPFFLLCWLFQYIMGYNYHDIFNDYFAYGVQISGLFYGLWGLYLLKKYLYKLHPFVVFLVIGSLLFGTNLYYYICREPGMSHVYSFFLFVLLLHCIKRYYSYPTIISAIYLGLIFGLITLIRPTNVIIIFLFLAWNISSFKEVINRFYFHLKHWKNFFLMGLFGGIVFIPQILYWYDMTGNYIFYSYSEEGFHYLLKPKFIAVLFDTRNGWILYTPISILFIISLFHTWKNRLTSTPIITIMLFVWTYLFSSWWCWWFGGAFGHRSYVEIYALLAIPFGYFLESLYHSSKRKLGFIVVLIIFFCHYNIALTDLYINTGRNWSDEIWMWNREKLLWMWKEIFT